VIARFTLRMGVRELQASGRRLSLFVISVSVGVAAIVAVAGFKANVLTSLHDQGRLLLGADLELESRFAFPPEVGAVLDSVSSAGGEVAAVTALPTMVAAVAGGRSALFTLRAVAPGYPFYGSVETEPPGAWRALSESGGVLADGAALRRLGAAIGDTLSIGATRLVVRGRVTQIPGDPGIRSAVNPRVYISAADLAATALIREGSLVTYRTFLRIDARRDVFRFLRRNRTLFGVHAISWDTAAERERDLSSAFDALGRFLGLVGLGALLLGGVGVAAAMHVYVRQRLASAAVLRCLGASGWTLVRIYVVQAVALALMGSILGAGAGIAIQAAIPRVLADVLPLDLDFVFEPTAVLAGLFAGLWTATVFAWRAILPVRHVPALGAVREAAIGSAGRAARGGGVTGPARDLVDRATTAAIAGTVVGLCIWQAGALGPGLAFALGAGVTLAALTGVARLLIRVTRHAAPSRSPFAIRQGVANLFRPQNQTTAAVVALGFGVFVIGTIAVVESNVRDRFSLSAVGIGANLAIFDVQPDQADEVLGWLRQAGSAALDVIPIIPARLAAVQGRPVAELLTEIESRRFGRRRGPKADSAPVARDSTGFGPPQGWALRREYRNSVRDTIVAGERLVAGHWWPDSTERLAGGSRRAGGPGQAGGPGRAGGLGRDAALRVSLETDVARALRVGVGDTITWDFQGRMIDSEIASIREVDWSRLEPNFVALFAPGSADELPQTDLILANIGDAETRAMIQDRVATALPGALVLDLTSIQQTIGRILDRAALATRFMGAFTLIAGLLILAATVVASRGLRLRENALLRALGASSGTLRGILVTEFLALGALAGLAGVVLASVSGWALCHWVFEMPFHLPFGTLAVLWSTAAILTLILGALGSRAVVRPSALGAIRRAEAAG